MVASVVLAKSFFWSTFETKPPSGIHLYFWQRHTALNFLSNYCVQQLHKTNKGKNITLTFTNHRHPYWHSQKFTLCPDMSIDTHLSLHTFSIKSWHRRVVGHLLGYKLYCVVVRLCLAFQVFRQSYLLRGGVRRDVTATVSGYFTLGHPPGAVKCFPNDGIVWFLCNSPFATFMKGSEIILHKADHPLLRAAAIRDRNEEIRMGHEVRIHLQQRSLL